MTAGELVKLIGKKGELNPTGKGAITFTVVIEDAKERFGRVDVLVKPITGNGEGWYSLESVILK